jgi:dihydropteroate synthase
MSFWQTSRFRIDLAQPRVMGIVNVTPDSFSDGGSYADSAAAVRHCEALIAQGADMLDIGGESTRPGSPAVPLELELARVIPVVREAVRLGIAISVDTYKPEVMRAVLDIGADIVNDIWALRQPGAREAIAAHPTCGVCLMHMHRDPQTMQVSPMEGDVVPQVRSFLAVAADELKALGIGASRIVLDPGIGWRAGPANPRSARSPGLPMRRRGCCPAWLRRCLQWSAVPASCVCTTCAKPWKRSPYGGQ